MDYEHGIDISVRDRLFMVWQESMQEVRRYQYYADEVKKLNGDGRRASEMFARFAEEEALRSAELIDVLKGLE